MSNELNISAKDIQEILFNENGGFITANKYLIHSIGLNETIIYQELISKLVYYQEQHDINDEFYCTQDDLERSTGLSQTAQSTAIKKLKQLKLIDIKIKGIPKRTHFQILDTPNPDNKKNENNHILIKYLIHGEKIIELMKEYNKKRVDLNNMKYKIKSLKQDKNQLKTQELENELFLLKDKIKKLKDFSSGKN